jgi:hypothetical protein
LLPFGTKTQVADLMQQLLPDQQSKKDVFNSILSVTSTMPYGLHMTPMLLEEISTT